MKFLKKTSMTTIFKESFWATRKIVLDTTYTHMQKKPIPVWHYEICQLWKQTKYLSAIDICTKMLKSKE